MATQLETIRHMELFDCHKFNTPVTVIGAGASGSWLVIMLAKLGITDITVYDFDIVEEHNIPNQGFALSHIGMPKVEALYDVIKRDTGTEIKIHNKKVEADERFGGYVFLMVDSMSGRKSIWENSLKYKTAIKRVFEPRLGLEVGRVYSVNPINPTHIKRYEETYYSDDDAEVSSCGSSVSVITSATAIASWCARQLISHHNDVHMDNEILLDFKYNNLIASRWE